MPDYPGRVILGIDSSLGTAVAVVERDGLVRAEASSDDPLGHAEVIGTLLQRVLAESANGEGARAASAGPQPPAGPTTDDALTHVAAGMGPGPFTGLRVGIAAARAFALGRGIPVVPVVSHDAIALELLLGEAMTDAASGAPHPPRFAVVTDARRREFAYTVYAGLDDDGLPVRITEPALVPRADIDAVLGDHDARKHEASGVSAAMLALAAARALAAGRVIGPAEPLYLRSPDVSPARVPKRVTA